jgi:hypothetical protein
MTNKDNRSKRLLMRIRAFNFGGRILHLIAKDKWTFPYIIKKMRTKVVPIFYVEFDESDWKHFHDKFVESTKRRNIKAA